MRNELVIQDAHVETNLRNYHDQAETITLKWKIS